MTVYKAGFPAGVPGKMLNYFTSRNIAIFVSALFIVSYLMLLGIIMTIDRLLYVNWDHELDASKSGEDLMANKSQGTWYVSFELPPGKRALARATETFPNEREAKKFARAKLVETPNVTAGTLNPHLPKRAIAPTLMLEWLDESG